MQPREFCRVETRFVCNGGFERKVFVAFECDKLNCHAVYVGQVVGLEFGDEQLEIRFYHSGIASGPCRIAVAAACEEGKIKIIV